MEITDEMLLNAPATIRSVKELQAKHDALLDMIGRLNSQNGKFIDLLEGLGNRLSKAEDWIMDLREKEIKASSDLGIMAHAIGNLDTRVRNLPVLGGLVK